MTITAKYAATCSACRGPILPGQSIEWSKGQPVRHTTCGTAASSPTVAPSRNRNRRPGTWTGCSCGSRVDQYAQLIPARNNCAQCRFDDE